MEGRERNILNYMMNNGKDNTSGSSNQHERDNPYITLTVGYHSATQKETIVLDILVPDQWTSNT